MPNYDKDFLELMLRVGTEFAHGEANDFRTREQTCVGCHRPLNTLCPVKSEGEREEGLVLTVCARCGEMMVVSDEWQLRRMTVEEQIELQQDKEYWRTACAMRQVIVEKNRRKRAYLN